MPYPGSESGDDDEYISTDVEEEVASREVTDGESDFEEDDGINSDGGEGGDRDIFDCCSDEGMDGCSNEGMECGGDDSEGSDN